MSNNLACDVLYQNRRLDNIFHIKQAQTISVDFGWIFCEIPILDETIIFCVKFDEAKSIWNLYF